MARLPEQKLWDWIRKGIAGRVYHERIELRDTSVGRPDVDFMHQGNYLPAELKANETPPVRSTTRLLGAKGLSQDQKNWHLRWRQAGGDSLIIVGAGAGRDRRMYILPGAHADKVNDMTEDDMRQYFGPRSVDFLVMCIKASHK